MTIRSLLSTHTNLHVIGECFEIDKETTGLTKEFPEQVHLLPAAANSLIGVALGMAMDGAKVVVQMADVNGLWDCIPQLIQETNSSFPLSLCIRVPINPNDKVPWELMTGLGIEIWCPRSKEQINSFLQQAVTRNSPTILLEPMRAIQENIQSDSQTETELLQTGDDVTLIAWGDNVAVAVQTATELAKDDFQVEVIALNKILPVPQQAIQESIQKTGRPVFIETPGSVLNTVINSGFWHLESQPVKTNASPTEITQAILDSFV